MVLASRSDELDRVKTNLAFLDALFETCPIGLVMLDPDLRYVHLNQALADMDGLPIEAHLGRRMDEFMIMSDGGEYRRMLRAVALGGPPVVGTLVGLRPRGHPDRDQVRSVSFFPLSQAVGSRPGVGGLMMDVTDREQAILEATASPPVAEGPAPIRQPGAGFGGASMPVREEDGARLRQDGGSVVPEEVPCTGPPVTDEVVVIDTEDGHGHVLQQCPRLGPERAVSLLAPRRSRWHETPPSSRLPTHYPDSPGIARREVRRDEDDPHSSGWAGCPRGRTSRGHP
ncbi:PAS domain-containing protein [Streptomyces sp. NBC_01264]|uniref:PAS domain-containing protein n=1 Tax=Streptomyces sp. NBC_01264 TaxID=2903804 RepID=UPI00225351B2|nr:PAS domain-containing protein [Streptomyces sp. NBC_01264]MCX4776007.1 PAS domain-containing protein [Streptomyces sp. NBC_01264]